MMIIGIDPGISGAICFLNNGEIVDVIDMPHMADGKKTKQVNASQIFNEISSRINNIPKSNICVVIEQVSAMPGQGSQVCLISVSHLSFKGYLCHNETINAFCAPC